jgi:hypothetical protein
MHIVVIVEGVEKKARRRPAIVPEQAQIRLVNFWNETICLNIGVLIVLPLLGIAYN